MNNKPQNQFFEDPIFKLLQDLNVAANNKNAAVLLCFCDDFGGGFLVAMKGGSHVNVAYAKFGDLFVPFKLLFGTPAQETLDIVNDLNLILEQNG